MKRTILDFFTKASRERSCTPDSDVEDPPTVTADASPASPGPAEQVEEPVPSTSTASEPPKKKTKTYYFQSDWLTHKDFRDWLRITTQDGKTIMHCAYCRECGPGTAGNSTFVTGHTLYKRESLKKHGDSNAHKKCRDKCCGPQQGRSTIQAAFDRQDAAQCTEVQAELKLKFNTAYMIGKEELPFTKFKPMIQLRMEDLLDYGELYIEFLLDYFHTVLGRNGCDIQHSKEEYRAMKIDVRRCFNRDKSYNDLYEALLKKEPYCTEYKNILHLVSIMLVLPISSAQCERGFSAQRRIKSSTRASMGVGTVEDLIRISADGPSLEDFDPLPSVRKWIRAGRRARRPEFSRPCPV